MTDQVRISSDASVIGHDGTLYVSWPDGTTTVEDEHEVGQLLLSCSRSRPYEELTAEFGSGVVDRLLRQGLLVSWVHGDVLRLHQATLGEGEGEVSRSAPPCPYVASDDARLLREYSRVGGFDLPDPDTVRGDLTDLFSRRVSARSFAGHPVPLPDVSTLLATALGAGPGRQPLPRVSGGPPARTHYPSPGALYPVEVALLAWDVADLSPGAYRYQPLGHCLSRTGAVSATEAAEIGGDTADGASAMIVLWCDLFSSTFSKYGTKGYRLMLLEAGHAMQNLVLVATALNIPALPLAGFRDHELARALGLVSPEQVPVYALLVGGGG